MTNNSVLDKIFEATYHKGLETTASRLSSAEVIKDNAKKQAKKADKTPDTKPKLKSKPSASVLNKKGRSFDVLGKLYDDTQTWLLNKTELLKKTSFQKG